MSDIGWELVLAVLGVTATFWAFLYEFVIKGYKRLGYRVQMDTTAADASHTPHAGVLQQLQLTDGQPLVDPSFVLLRIENNGLTMIDTSDYAVQQEDKVGIRVIFPGRTVVGMVVTELSHEFLRPNFSEGSGLGKAGDSTVLLPKVPLNRSQHYKILAVLERAPGNVKDKFDDPKIIGGIKAGFRHGSIQETTSQTGTSNRVYLLISSLVVLMTAQAVISILRDDPFPLDCASGSLTIAGSTAFTPVLREAKQTYEETCPDAHFTIDTRGSAEGLSRLNERGLAGQGDEMLAFSDGEKPDTYTMLLPRPIAFSLFALVANKDAAVRDLSLAQIRQLYTGQITNWRQAGGPDLPVRLVSRHSDSGSRKTFEEHVLQALEPNVTSQDCLQPAPGAGQGMIRCEVRDTGQLLNTVERTSGAFGYAELRSASERKDLLLVRIGGHPVTFGEPTFEEADRGAYPFWETEFAYTYGEPKTGSLAASFLRYLTNEVGKDIVRSHGHRPCAELSNPVKCRPTAQTSSPQPIALGV